MAGKDAAAAAIARLILDVSAERIDRLLDAARLVLRAADGIAIVGGYVP